MRVSDFHFDLPSELIAQHPPAERDGAKMLTVDRRTGELEDRTFRELPSLLREGDLLVLNDSRVIPARMYGRRAGLRTQANSPRPSGLVEVLLTERRSSTDWRALVKPGRKAPVGERLDFFAPDTPGDLEGSESGGIDDPAEKQPVLSANIIEAGDSGERTLRFSETPDFFALLDQLGHIPLPPYLHRADSPADRARYQTVYAGSDTHGSSAAPTAGLHFTSAVLDAIRNRGVQIEYVTLHVGLGTFQPVRVEQLADIRLHSEHYTLPPATAAAVNLARRESRRIIAAGTTTVRTLEHCAATANADLERSKLAGTSQRELTPHSGETSIFLSPGHTFQLVDALLTNFHLPQSTLLMLVCAFAGQSNVLSAYRHAVEQKYRFFSYGDCMFLS